MIATLTGFLTEHGVTLLVGATVVLGVGTLATAASRAPVHRGRLAELSLWAFGAWLVLAVLPLPRWQPPAQRTARPVTAIEHLFGEMPARADVEVPAHEPEPQPPVATDALPRTERNFVLRNVAVLPHAEPSPLPARDHASQAPAVEPPLPMSPTFAWIDAPTVLAAIYVAGAALGLGFLAFALFALHRLLRRTTAPPTAVTALLADLCRGTLAREPRVRIAPDDTRPFCVGGPRATIVLPRRLAAPAHVSQLRQVLLHEIAHLRHRDHHGRAVFAMALPLLWFHPLYWALRRTARLSAELLADDWAAQRTSRTSYARELIALSEQIGGRPVLAGAPVFRSRTEFYQRMKMLLQRDEALQVDCTPRRRRAQGVATLALAACAAGLFGVDARAQDPGDLRKEMRQLRIEREQLQAELEDLRAMLEKLRTRRGYTRAQDAAPEPPPERRLPGELLPRERPPQAPPAPRLPTIGGGLAPRATPPALPRRSRRAAAPSPFRDPVRGREVPAPDAPRPPALPGGLPLAEVEPIEVPEPTEMEPIEVPEPPEPREPPGFLEGPELTDVTLPLFKQRSQPRSRAAASETEEDAYALQLATRAIELRGEMELLEAELADAQNKAESGRGPRLDAQRAKIRLETVHRKMQAVHQMVEAVEHSAAWDLTQIQRRTHELSEEEISQRTWRISRRMKLLKSAR